MDPLLPTLRKRKRYIIFGIISRDNIPKKILYNNILNICIELYGELELSKYGIVLISYENHIGIIRCWHNYIDKVLSILALIKSIENK